MFTTAPTDREMYVNGMIEVPIYGPNGPPPFANGGFSDGGSRGGCPPGGAGAPCVPGGSPVITPGPTQGSGGLITPSDVEPQGTIPPSPTADSASSRRFFSGSSWASKSRSANSSKPIDSSSPAKFSSIEPAGFQNQQKPNRYSNSQNQERKSDEQE